VTRRPLADLRHAFELDDYAVEGVVSGDHQLYGSTRRHSVWKTPHRGRDRLRRDVRQRVGLAAIRGNGVRSIA
jgi:hypothetical protein